jgi:hypothetical protein
MKNLSLVVKSFLEQGFFSVFFLIDLKLINDSGTIVNLHFTSLSFDVLVEGITYSSDNFLSKIDSHRATTILNRNEYKLMFLDNNYLFKPFVNKSSAGGLLNIRIGFINTTGDILVSSNGYSFEPHMPILDPLDLFIAYKGGIDNFKYIISEDQGAFVEITGASPLAALDAVNTFYSNAFALKQRLPAGTIDTSFDQIMEGSKKIELLWGKM